MTPNSKGNSVSNIPEPIIPKPINHKRQKATPNPKKKDKRLTKTPQGSGFTQTQNISVAEFVVTPQSAGDVIDAIIDSTVGATIGKLDPPGKTPHFPDPGKKVSKGKPSKYSQFAAEIAVHSMPTRKTPPPSRGA